MADIQTKTIIYGYGFDPEELQHHFMVVIPKAGKNNTVKVYERFAWHGQEDLEATAFNNKSESILKTEIPYRVWRVVAPYVSQEFNYRLRQDHMPAGRWKAGNNPVNRLMGKELVLLLWAIEDVKDINVLPKAIINWQGLRPEERWFLYGLANAATGMANEKDTGWRKGIKYGLLENPADEEKIKQISLWDMK